MGFLIDIYFEGVFTIFAAMFTHIWDSKQNICQINLEGYNLDLSV